jgi:hypothetical protein
MDINAYRFRADFTLTNESDSRTFSGIAYGGGALNHMFWDAPLVFDLSSTVVDKKIPALIDHDRSKRAGVAHLSIDNNKLLASGTLLSNQFGSEVAADSDQGFPWQMSVHIEPGRIDTVKKGEKSNINGQTLSGPLYVFRDNKIREVSFTATGVDDTTSAHIMSMSHSQDGQMTDNTDELAAIKTQLTELQTQFAAEKARADTAETALAEAKKKARDESIARLEKDLSKTFSADEKTLMFGMDDSAFNFMCRMLKQSRPALPTQLFSVEQSHGTENTNPLLADAQKRYGK